MDDETLSALANPLTRGSPCNSPGRKVAADSLLSLLRNSPQMPSCMLPNNALSGPKRSAPSPVGISSPKSSTVEECLLFQRHQVKRQKRAKKEHRVTFAPVAEDLVTYIACQPYVHGLNDAECLQIFRGDIWYTDNDYADFWKDRINTIRVYRSVRGNMTGLSQHYTVRGLEHYLKFEPHLSLQRRQHALVMAVLAEQQRQVMLKDVCYHSTSGQATSEDAGPETIRSIVARLTVVARQEALERASLDVASSDDEKLKDGSSSGDSSEEEDDSDGEYLETYTKSKSLGVVVAPSATASTFSSIATRPPSGHHHTFGLSSWTSTARVNMAALREMNIRMLRELQQKPLSDTRATASAASNSDTGTRFNSSLLHNVHEEVEQWSRLLHVQHHQRRASSSAMQQEPHTFHARSTGVEPCMNNAAAFRRDSLALARLNLRHQQQNYERRRTSLNPFARMSPPSPHSPLQQHLHDNHLLPTHVPKDQRGHHGTS